MSLKKTIFSVLIFFGIALAAIGLFRAKKHTYQVSVMAIFQNEDRFLAEWIDFHRLLGVEHFYLFNNLSTDEYQTVLKPYLDRGIVELHDWPYKSKQGEESDWTQIQAAAYRKGLELAKGQTKWLAIIDTDEFLLPAHERYLTDFLANYEECSGLLINWQMFGTSNIKRIKESLIKELNLQANSDHLDHHYCKSIVRPECVKYCVDPHNVIYYPWSYAVDSDKNIFPWKFHFNHPVKIDKIRINHYWSRDEDFFFERKISRNENWGDPEDRRNRCLQRNESYNQIQNLDIQRFVQSLLEFKH